MLTYIDQLWSHLNDIKLEPKLLERPNFLVRSTKIFYYNHTFSKKEPIILDENVLSLLNLANKFA